MTDEMQNQYLIFELEEEYAIALEKIVVIVEYNGVTTVPETPDYIVGVINYRGLVLPVIDLRIRFKKPEVDVPRRCIVITELDGINFGLMVDRVSDIVTIGEDAVKPPPQVGGNYSFNFIKSIGVADEKMVLIIDTDKLINLNDLEELSESEEEEK